MMGKRFAVRSAGCDDLVPGIGIADRRLAMADCGFAGCSLT